MKSLINVSIIALILFSMCIGQTSTSELKESITLEVGTTHTFEFHDNGEYVGYNTYTVKDKRMYNEVEAYYIESTVDLNTDDTALYMDATYIVDTQGRCLHYEFSGTINGETHTMTADFTESTVHITASTPGEEYDKTITIAQHTFTLDNNMICQWDIAFSAAVLEEGGIFAVYMFAAQPMKTAYIRASIDEVVSVNAAGKTWECFKLEFSTPAGYTMYVTKDGQLIKMENESGLVVTLSS